MSKKNIVTGRSSFIQSFIDLFPKNLRLRFNPRRYAIESFVRSTSKKVTKDSLFLDAGAGPCPYKPMFAHAKYQATDFTDEYGLMDFTCNLDKIPKKDNAYDFILSTEVLEHVESPQAVINEFYRILKKDGKLLLTTPQQYMMHQKPYNFYYFTYYGLESLLKKAGFKKLSIKPMGGYFWALGDIIKFNSLLLQIKNKPLRLVFKIIEFPFTQIILPFLFFHLDFLDKKRDWTMGYCVEATK